MTTLEEQAIELLKPVLEGSMIIATHYAQKCGRNTITAKDVQYGLKYAARHVAGRITETMFPEIYEGSDSVEEVSDDDEPFTRYEGLDEYCLQVNHAVDTWDEWEPESPLEEYIKRAIDSRSEDHEEDSSGSEA
jgi:hypothetical protein